MTTHYDKEHHDALRRSDICEYRRLQERAYRRRARFRLARELGALVCIALSVVGLFVWGAISIAQGAGT